MAEDDDDGLKAVLGFVAVVGVLMMRLLPDIVSTGRKAARHVPDALSSASRGADDAATFGDDLARHGGDGASAYGRGGEIPPHLPTGPNRAGSYDAFNDGRRIVDDLSQGAAERIEQDARFSKDSSLAEVETVTKENMTAVATELSQASPPKVEFEVLTGKLKIIASVNMGGAKVSAGDVNLYKVGTVAAAAAYLCRALTDAKRGNCVAQALDNAFRDELKKEASEKQKPKVRVGYLQSLHPAGRGTHRAAFPRRA